VQINFKNIRSQTSIMSLKKCTEYTHYRWRDHDGCVTVVYLVWPMN